MTTFSGGDQPGGDAARATLRWRSPRLRDQKPCNVVDADSDAVNGADLDATPIAIATATLHLLDRAPNRLDSGPHGWCTGCHRRIAASRLHAMPCAMRCRDCEAAREHDAQLASSRLRDRSRPESRH